jgi:microcystin-dependent protein
MATTLNAGTTAATGLNIITDTTGAMAIQTSGTTAISISAAQAVTLTNPLPAGSGGTGITSLGTGVATFLGTPSSSNLRAALTDETGTGSAVFATSPTISSPDLTGTPTAPTAAAGTNTTQIATTAFVTQNAVLTGALLMWPTASAPSGYLLCAGAAVSRTTYAALFAVIGTTFGVGDGSTTFNLPNYLDRFPIGAGTIAASIGATGGTKDAVVVSHTHTASSSVSDPGHSHSTPQGAAPNGGGPGSCLSTSQGSAGAQSTNASGTGISVSTSITTAGVSGTNQNLPPYLGINFIIKT